MKQLWMLPDLHPLQPLLNNQEQNLFNYLYFPLWLIFTRKVMYWWICKPFHCGWMNAKNSLVLYININEGSSKNSFLIMQTHSWLIILSFPFSLYCTPSTQNPFIVNYIKISGFLFQQLHVPTLHYINTSFFFNKENTVHINRHLCISRLLSSHIDLFNFPHNVFSLK